MVAEATANEIILRNRGLFYTIANKHGPIGNDYDTDDLAQELMVKALKAVRNGYDIDRGTEATFLSVVSWRALNKIRRRVYGTQIDVHDLLKDSPSAAAFFKALFHELIEGVSKKSKELAETIKMLYVTGGDMARASRAFSVPVSRFRRHIEQIRELPVGRAIAGAF